MKRQFWKIRRFSRIANLKIYFPLIMRRATRSAFKIVLRPAGKRAQKMLPLAGEQIRQRHAVPKRKEAGSVFLFALTVQHPACGKQQHTAAGQHRHGPVQLAGLGQNGFIRGCRGDRIIRFSRAYGVIRRARAYGVIRGAGTYRVIRCAGAHRRIRVIRLLREIGGVRVSGLSGVSGTSGLSGVSGVSGMVAPTLGVASTS